MGLKLLENDLFKVKELFRVKDNVVAPILNTLQLSNTPFSPYTLKNLLLSQNWIIFWNYFFPKVKKKWILDIYKCPKTG